MSTEKAPAGKAEDTIKSLKAWLQSFTDNPDIWERLWLAWKNPDFLATCDLMAGKSETEVYGLISEDIRRKLENLLDCINSEGVRSKVLLFAAEIENALEALVQKKLRPCRAKKPKDDELFRRMAPLSTFAGKIAIAYRIGAICRTRANALDAFRDLRNTCAHAVTSFDVEALANSSEAKEFVQLTAEVSPHNLNVVLIAAGVVPIHGKSFSFCCLEHLSYLWGTTNSAQQIEESHPVFASMMQVGKPEKQL